MNDTISNVVLTVRYIARDGDGPFKAAAVKALRMAMAATEEAPLMRLFSARHEFSTGWHGFLHRQVLDPQHPDKQSLLLDPGSDRFPYQFQGKTISVRWVEAYLKLKNGANVPAGFDLFLSTLDAIATPDPNTDKLSLQRNPVLRGLLQGDRDVETNGHGTWRLWAKKVDLAPLIDDVEEIFVVLHYAVQASK